jgi:hypothetical protein
VLTRPAPVGLCSLFVRQDKFSFPIFDPEWGADEELLLMEAIETYGLGNWADVAEQVGSKTLHQCEQHYITHYLNSPTYPIPVQRLFDRMLLWPALLNDVVVFS